MTVCVFETASNKVYFDNTVMYAGIYSHTAKKCLQFENGGHIYTMLLAGNLAASQRIATYIHNVICNQSVFNVGDRDVLVRSDDRFRIMLIDYDVRVKSTRVYEFNDTTLPIEITWGHGALLVNSDFEIELALRLAKKVCDEHLKFLTAGELIENLRGLHTYITEDTYISSVSITSMSTECDYDLNRPGITDGRAHN